MIDVSVIVVNYNTRTLTKACLDSVFEHTSGISFELLLVDNASTDGSRELFSADTRIRYIYNDDNLGFGKANNIAFELAQGRNVLFLNSDTVLVNNAVKHMSDFLDGNAEAGACGGNLFSAEMQENFSYAMSLPSISYELNNLLHNIPGRIRHGNDCHFNHGDKPRRVGYVTGADLMVKRSVLDSTSCFDTDFFMYYEDTELCFRIRKAGYGIWNVPTANIIHLEGASAPSDPARLKRKTEMIRSSRVLYAVKTGHSNVYAAIWNMLASENARKLFFVR